MTFKITNRPRPSNSCHVPRHLELHAGDEGRQPGQTVFGFGAFFRDAARLESLLPAIRDWVRERNITATVKADGAPFLGMVAQVTLESVTQAEVDAFIAAFKPDTESSIEMLR